MKIAHLDLECSNLNADWGVIICGCIKWDNGKSKGKLESFRMTDYDQKDMMDHPGYKSLNFYQNLRSQPTSEFPVR